MKFCPLCTAPLIFKVIDLKDRLTCSKECGFVFWNNPVPVVAGIVETLEGIVLSHNKLWPSDSYSLTTGFLEKEETPEEAIIREVHEELGLKASDPSFVNHYIYPQQNQLILVYHLKAEGKFKLGEEIDAVCIHTREELKAWPFGMENMDGWPFGCGWAIRDWLESCSEV